MSVVNCTNLIKSVGWRWTPSSNRRRISPSRCHSFPSLRSTQNPHHLNSESTNAFKKSLIALISSGLILVSPLGLGLTPVVVQARTLTPSEQRSVKLFNSNTASVVNVTNLGMQQDAFTLDIMEIPQGAGTGIIWDQEGHVITNFHVIRQATEVQITLPGGEQIMASVVGVDPDKDVAVLKIKTDSKQKLQPVKIGVSSDLFVGQQVYAIGNPFGLDHTLTSGIISGTERELTGAADRPIQGVIQTDAAINPGNSGGPLLDSGGSLIGMNTAIYSPSGASSGVGFAIPVDIIKSSVDQILTYGRVIRPFLGISFASDRSIDQLGVKGILVLRVQQGSPAAKAGIKGTFRDDEGRLHLGDVIVKLNDQKITTSSDLFRELDRLSVGDEAKLKVMRQDSVEDITILLEERRDTNA